MIVGATTQLDLVLEAVNQQEVWPALHPPLIITPIEISTYS